jgi:hypothetical protein
MDGAACSRLEWHRRPLPQNIGDAMESADRRRKQHWEQHQQKHHDELQVGHGSLISPQGGIDLDFGEYERSAVILQCKLFAASSALRSA